MGIPSYFVHIVKNHSNIIKKYCNKTINIHNLYIDSNSVIYDSLKEIEFKNNEDFEKKVIKWVCDKLLYYINLIKPSNKVLIAFDGVAPVAKLEQQRNRRYKSWFINNYINNSSDKKLNESWNSSAITPGTKFMNNLYTEIVSYFNYKCNNIDIIISGTNDYGEGEHKIFKYIRKNKDYHSDTNTIIYGLDADLIMLTLIHTKISDNLYLFRETPHFISTINNNLIPNEHYVMDIYELNEKINLEMTNQKGKNCIYDYIFLCFFLGNDFMPHFPALNIRTNGIQILLETYFQLFGSTKEVIVDEKKIYWKNLKKLIYTLSKNEEEYGIEEMKIRAKMANKLKYNNNNNNNDNNNKEHELMSLPLSDRKSENYINIGVDGWQERYYSELFGIEINDERKKQICLNFLEGLDWNFKYYTIDCPDWTWRYNYKYPPLLQDLFKYIPEFDTQFIEFKKADPVAPLVQLSYVLPRNSLDLLPNELYEKLILKHGDLYKLDFEIQWAYCKYFWESHIILPSINISTLENIVNSCK